MSNLKPTTTALIKIAKERRTTLKRGAAQHAEGSIRKTAVAKTAEQRYRKGHAEGLRDIRKRGGRKAAVQHLMGVYRRSV